jgi:hypothetical protein
MASELKVTLAGQHLREQTYRDAIQFDAIGYVVCDKCRVRWTRLCGMVECLTGTLYSPVRPDLGEPLVAPGQRGGLKMKGSDLLAF